MKNRNRAFTIVELMVTVSIIALLIGLLLPPGTTPDVLARRVAEKLAPSYAKSVIVENRTGAGGQLAVTAVKGAPADGSTILLTPLAMLGVYPYTYRSLPYNAEADLAPVSLGVKFDIAFADPPYESKMLDRLIESWHRQKFSTILAIEHARVHLGG